jgi:hypothetical protein
MGKTVEVDCGWVIQDQAPIIPGLAFGPNWLQGARRTGRLSGGTHNLLGKEIVFQAKGIHALGAIVKQMKNMPFVKVNCGIREGMTVEAFRTSEFGGGDDQITEPVTRENMTRVEYFVVARELKESERSLGKLMMSYGVPMVEFGISTGIGATKAAKEVSAIVQIIKGCTEFVSSGKDIFEIAETMHKKQLKGLLGIAAKAEWVEVRLTSRKTDQGQIVAKHKHTHPMPYFAKDITDFLVQETLHT